MTTSRTIAVLCALCALSALPTHARVFDVQAAQAVRADTTAATATTAAPGPSTTPEPNHPYCQTCVVVNETRYQLIRADDEVALCKDHLYCDCQEHKLMKCTGWTSTFESFDPEKQKCALGFSCDGWSKKHSSTTLAPATSADPTATPNPANPTTVTPKAPTSQPPTRQPPTTQPPTTQPPTKAPSPAPSPAPVPTSKPSSAWANKATALTFIVACAASVAAL